MTETDEVYLSGRIGRALAEHPDIGELDVHVSIRAGRVFLTGHVSTPERQELISALVRELCPDREVRNETTVPPHDPPDGAEDLR